MKWLLLILWLFIPNPVFAEQPAQVHYTQGENLFRDNFTRGNETLTVSDQWHKEGSGTNLFFIVSNVLTVQDYWPASSGTLTTNINFDGNIAIELDLSNNDGVIEGINFKRTNPQNSYTLYLNHHSSEISLVKTIQGVTSTLKSTTTFPLTNHHWYHLEIEDFENHFQVWIDNQFLFSVDDPQSQLSSGAVGITYSTEELGHAEITFDNFQVTPLAASHRNPVIFIPGIGGSEFQTAQNIIWSEDNGHSSTYSHAYQALEQIWVNYDQAIIPGNDDYFDVLKLNNDGQTSKAAINLTGQVTPYGYANLIQIFQDMGYIPGVDFFILAYDWRKDILSITQPLDQLINHAREQNNQSQVNLVVHSMGGLIAKAYLNDQLQSAKVHKLIEMGVPHQGSVEAVKDVIYGAPLGKTFLNFTIGISGSEISDLLQNFTSAYELFPNFYWYTNLRGTDQDYKLGLNPVVENIAINTQQFINPSSSPNPDLKIYQIAGSGQPTLGQIIEDWWVYWPVKLWPKTDEVFINGDGTVPLFSAIESNGTIESAHQYFTEESHSQLVQQGSLAFNIVRQILSEGDPPSLTATPLEGIQLIVGQDAQIQFDDPNNNIKIDKVSSTTHLFIKKKQTPAKVKIVSKNKLLNIDVRHYSYSTIQTTNSFQFPTNINQVFSLTLDPEIQTAPVIVSISDGDSNSNSNSEVTPPSPIPANSSTPTNSPDPSPETSPLPVSIKIIANENSHTVNTPTPFDSVAPSHVLALATTVDTDQTKIPILDQTSHISNLPLFIIFLIIITIIILIIMILFLYAYLNSE